MAAKKLKVEFVKRYEDRDKNGNKVVIPAGTVMSMTRAQVESAGTKVRVIEGAADKGAVDPNADDDEGTATNTGGDGQGNENGDEGNGD